MLADTNAALATALGMMQKNLVLVWSLGLDFDVAALGNNKRMRRFSALIENGIVTIVNIEPNGVPMQCSLANEMLSRL
jgi:peroxiredoxin